MTTDEVVRPGDVFVCCAPDRMCDCVYLILPSSSEGQKVFALETSSDEGHRIVHLASEFRFVKPWMRFHVRL